MSGHSKRPTVQSPEEILRALVFDRIWSIPSGVKTETLWKSVKGWMTFSDLSDCLKWLRDNDLIVCSNGKWWTTNARADEMRKLLQGR